eukprot:Skav203099  [mRNA]  locus=scaffold447:252434:252957:+ [translate_table: standard]
MSTGASVVAGRLWLRVEGKRQMDDLLQAYLAQYNHFPRAPVALAFGGAELALTLASSMQRGFFEEQLCIFAKNHGQSLRYDVASRAWLAATSRAASTRQAAAVQCAGL